MNCDVPVAVQVFAHQLAIVRNIHGRWAFDTFLAILSRPTGEIFVFISY